MFRKVIVAGSLVVLAAGSTACATKGFVRQNVGEVNDKVDSLGRSVEETQEEIGQVVEGVKAAKAVHEVAEKLGIEMPIVNQVYRILYEGLSPREAVAALMRRELKRESDHG